MALVTLREGWTTGRAQRVRERASRPPRTPLLTVLGRAAGRLLPSWRTIRTATLSLAGFGCLTAAAWTVHLAAGLAVAGVSLLLVEWLTGDGR